MKIFFFLLTYLISSSYIFSQEFGGGIVAGLSTSQIWGDEMAGFNKAGITVGAFVNRNISEKLKAQFEMRFIQKGSKNPYDGYKIHLEYIEMPILLQYSFKKFYVETGLGYAHLVRAYEGDEDFHYNISRPRPDIISYFGVAYSLSDRLFINGRYAPSIVYVDKFRNLAVTLTLCYNLVK